MPVVVPTNSAITTPTSEKEMALGKAAKVQASALGTLTLHRICRGEAPSVWQNWRMCFSTDREPLKVLKKMRKNTTNQTVTTFARRPRPNIMVMSGTMAMRGSELKQTMKGFSVFASNRVLAEDEAGREAGHARHREPEQCSRERRCEMGHEEARLGAERPGPQLLGDERRPGDEERIEEGVLHQIGYAR